MAFNPWELCCKLHFARGFCGVCTNARSCASVSPFSSLAKEVASASSSAGLQPPSRQPLPLYKGQGHGDCRTTPCSWRQTAGGNKWSNCHINSLMDVVSLLQFQKCCAQLQRSPSVAPQAKEVPAYEPLSASSLVTSFWGLLDIIWRKYQHSSNAPLGLVQAWKLGSMAPSFFSLLAPVGAWKNFHLGLYLSHLLTF